MIPNYCKEPQKHRLYHVMDQCCPCWVSSFPFPATRIYPSSVIQQMFNVQPMTGSVGSIFYQDLVYGKKKKRKKKRKRKP